MNCKKGSFTGLNLFKKIAPESGGVDKHLNWE